MKKLFISFCLIFQMLVTNCNLSSQENSFIQTYRNLTVAGLLKVIDIQEAIANIGWVKKLTNLLSRADIISDKSLSSDELLIITNKDKDLFHIKFINLYEINSLKDKFKIPKAIEINKEIYDKIKTLTSKLEYTNENGFYHIKLPDEQIIVLKTDEKDIEAVILSNKNLRYICDDLWIIDREKI